MNVLWVRKGLLVTITLVGLLTAAPHAGHALSERQLNALMTKINKHVEAQNYPEAIALGKRLVGITKKQFGAKHDEHRVALRNLGILYQKAARYDEAEPYFERALKIAKQKYGTSHPQYANALSYMGRLYMFQGRTTPAEKAYRRALEIDLKALGPNHIGVGFDLDSLGALLAKTGRYAEAEPMLKRSLKISERKRGFIHRDTDITLINLLSLYQDMGRYGAALKLAMRSLRETEKQLGNNHPQVAICLARLAKIHQRKQEYDIAEKLYMRALEVDAQKFGLDHPQLAVNLNALSTLYQNMGRRDGDIKRYQQAEPLLKSAITILEKHYGSDFSPLATYYNNLATLSVSLKRYEQAETLFKRVLALDEKNRGENHPDVARDLSNLAELYRRTGRHQLALPLAKRSLAIDERAFGPHHPFVADHLIDLSRLLEADGDFSTALVQITRATDILIRRARITGAATSRPGEAAGKSIKRGITSKDFAFLEYIKNAFRQAIFDKGRETQLLAQSFIKAQWPNNSAAAAAVSRMSARLAVGAGALGDRIRERDALVSEMNRLNKNLVAAVSQPSNKRQKSKEAQWRKRIDKIEVDLARIEEAMSKRFSNYSELASPEPMPISEIQEALKSDEVLIKYAFSDKYGFAFAISKTDRRWVRIGLGTKALKDHIDALRCGLDRSSWSDVSTRCGTLLEMDLGDAPQEGDALPFDVVRAHLLYKALFGQFEDLIEGKSLLIIPSGPLTQLPFQVLVGEQPKIFVPRDSDQKKHVSGRGWFGVKIQDITPLNLEFQNVPSTEGTRVIGTVNDGPAALAGVVAGDFILEVDEGKVTNAREFADLINTKAPGTKVLLRIWRKGKEIMVTATLGSLPPPTLTHRFAGHVDYSQVVWLGTKNALTILPAVSSLKALRQDAKASKAPKPLIGFGNPLLNGGNGEAQAAKSARGINGCATAISFKTAQFRGNNRRGVKPLTGGAQLASLRTLRVQSPLPETADELCRVARSANADLTEDIYLGSRATEARLKALNKDDALTQYKVVHFATHGTLAGELKGTSEPGLILSPPDKATQNDDGYLSAFEIAGLKFDADWVILSACNTAGGGAESAEALSGMARAFFYAGARALLVSHWYVDSASAVALITKTFDELRNKEGLGRAEALRRAMMALINSGTYTAHPEYWAPFVVVGEGAGTG